MAVWTYYRGALRDPGIDAGSTTVAMVPQRGWFWYIPLPDDVVSVGVVAEKDYLFGQPRDLAEIFHGEVEKNLWIKQHLAQGSSSASTTPRASIPTGASTAPKTGWCWWAMPSPSSIRSFRRAFTWR